LIQRIEVLAKKRVFVETSDQATFKESIRRFRL